MYNLIGKLLILFLAISFILSALALYMGKISIRKHIRLAGFFALILDFFYMPIKYLFCRFSDPRILDQWMVSLKNTANRDAFKKSSSRIMFVPHCMRSLDCPAHSTRDGIQCVECGKCVLGELRKKAESEGYGFYIVTGSSFVERILRGSKADGVLVIACNYEINKGMRALRGSKIPILGIPLLKDGCFNTCVDLDEVLLRMKKFRNDAKACE